MSLTKNKIKDEAKPRNKPFRLSDGKGLALLVRPNGSMSWQLRYRRIGGKEAVATLGQYSDVSLDEARSMAERTRGMIAQGKDPVIEKRKTRSHLPVTFADCAEAWYTINCTDWAQGHSKRTRSIIDRDLLPLLGRQSPRDITPPDVLAALQRIERRGAIPTAKKAKGIVSMVFGYAISIGIADADPTAHLKRAMVKAPKVRHRPAIVDPDEFGAFLDTLWQWDGGSVAKQLLQIGAYTFQRPAEIRSMRWEDVDLERGLWSYHVTKVSLDHAVPLAPHAIEVIRERMPFQRRSEFVFGKTSDQLTGKLLHKLGYRDVMTAHGYRATARTLLAERLKVNPELIERQLSHVVRSQHGRAYNRTEFLDERTEMMCRWAKYVDGLRVKARAKRLGIAAVS